MKDVSECTHDEIYFGSGDYYVFCRECGAKWGRLKVEGPKVRVEYGIGVAGNPIGCDPEAANKGPPIIDPVRVRKE